jgi:hypothetical protein
MQISGVSLALTWPCSLCLLRVLLCTMPLLHAFPFPSTLGEVTLYLLSQAGVCIYSSHGSSPVEFSSHHHFYKLSRSWLLDTRCRCHPLWPGYLQFVYLRLVYLQFCEGFPSPPLQHSVRPTLFVTCLYCSYCLFLVSLFFLGGGLVCPEDYADLAQGCLWKYSIPLSSPCPHLPKPSGHGRLEVARRPSWFLCLI